MDLIKKAKNPDEIKLIEINDPHFAPASPPAFKAAYLTFLEDNLDQVYRYAIAQNVDAILCSGDVFHLKEPRSNPHWLVARVVQRHRELREAGIPTYGIGGNHDYRFGSLEVGLPGSPLEVLVRSGHYHLLDDNEVIIEGNGFSVRCAGGSYRHNKAEHVRDKTKKGATWLVTLGHFWIGTQTGEFFGEQLYGHDFFRDSESDIICIGHHHEDKGIVERHGKLFVSQGSISITGAHAHDLNRRPAAALITLTKEKRSCALLRVKMPAIGDLLDLEKHEQIKTEKKEMEQFITTLSSTVLSTSDPTAVLKELNPTQEILDRATMYLEKAEAEK